MNKCLCIVGAIILAVVLSGKKGLRLNKLLGGWEVVVVSIFALVMIMNEIPDISEGLGWRWVREPELNPSPVSDKTFTNLPYQIPTGGKKHIAGIYRKSAQALNSRPGGSWFDTPHPPGGMDVMTKYPPSNKLPPRLDVYGKVPIAANTGARRLSVRARHTPTRSLVGQFTGSSQPNWPPGNKNIYPRPGGPNEEMLATKKASLLPSGQCNQLPVGPPPPKVTMHKINGDWSMRKRDPGLDNPKINMDDPKCPLPVSVNGLM